MRDADKNDIQFDGRSYVFYKKHDGISIFWCRLIGNKPLKCHSQADKYYQRTIINLFLLIQG